MIDDVALALLALLPRTRPVARLLRLLVEVETSDARLAELQPGETAEIAVPEDIPVRIRSRGGKRFGLAAVRIVRLA